MKRILLLLAIFTTLLTINAQSHSHSGKMALTYPNIEGYLTLKTDLHQHTVFSDGNVWPTIRVQEALRENLDAISLTEHLEYQPHIDDIPHPDRNRSYHLALEEAKEHGLLIVHGSEITRSEPVGHSNAVFISDANKLMADDPAIPFQEAKKQNAFVFWNHPAWHAQSPSGNPVLSDFQEERIKNGELHGIEVINTFDYAEESLALALKHNLTIMGTSDIHGLIDWDYIEKGMHRPITLVFAKEKNLESIREALFAGRTVAVYNSLLVGKSEFLKPLIKASIQINEATYIPETQVLKVDLENISSSDLMFENQMPYTLYSKPPVFEIPAGETVTLQIKTLEKKESISLDLKALGAYTAPKEQPVISWKIIVE
ncbi:MAG: Sb-PDE family phosphodiesterase [Eudoraea sp.]|uniref:Sb-PDE family phosphodiesterase n=1 Tax=Eudoraea sp. TaxID=1979955 RepID=UPI003C77D7C5